MRVAAAVGNVAATPERVNCSDLSLLPKNWPRSQASWRLFTEILELHQRLA
jgi:hypothetical protein